MWGRICIYILQMLPHCKIFTIQFLYLACHHFNKLISIRNKSVYLIFNTLKLICDFKFKGENCSL